MDFLDWLGPKCNVESFDDMDFERVLERVGMWPKLTPSMAVLILGTMDAAFEGLLFEFGFVFGDEHLDRGKSVEALNKFNFGWEWGTWTTSRSSHKLLLMSSTVESNTGAVKFSLSIWEEEDLEGDASDGGEVIGDPTREGVFVLKLEVVNDAAIWVEDAAFRAWSGDGAAGWTDRSKISIGDDIDGRLARCKRCISLGRGRWRVLMGVWVVSVWVVSVSPIVSKASEADVLEAVLVLRWMY